MRSFGKNAASERNLLFLTFHPTRLPGFRVTRRKKYTEIILSMLFEKLSITVFMRIYFSADDSIIQNIGGINDVVTFYCF